MMATCLSDSLSTTIEPRKAESAVKWGRGTCIGWEWLTAPQVLKGVVLYGPSLNDLSMISLMVAGETHVAEHTTLVFSDKLADGITLETAVYADRTAWESFSVIGVPLVRLGK